jgi:hypothetical protein
MDKMFWRGIVENDFKVPGGYNAAELTPELLGFLGSTDIAVRDPFGYTILTAWMVRERHYTPDELRAMRDELLANLDKGIGENGTDSVFLRSFSMLMVAVMLYRDLQESFLSQAEINVLVDKALWYFAAEQDLRGYLEDKGWAHSVAHTADVFKFLARNPLTDVVDHLRILMAIGDKLMLPVKHIYVYGEDERLVSAVMDVLKRSTVTAADWQGWIDRFIASRVGWEADDFELTIHAPRYNSKAFLRSLYFRLETTPDVLPESATLKVQVLEAVKAFDQ